MAYSVTNMLKISQKTAELWTFSFFQHGDRPPSWILLQVKNDVTARCALSMSTTLPNLVTIAQTAAEYCDFQFFKMAAAAILDLV